MKLDLLKQKKLKEFGTDFVTLQNFVEKSVKSKNKRLAKNSRNFLNDKVYSNAFKEIVENNKLDVKQLKKAADYNLVDYDFNSESDFVYLLNKSEKSALQLRKVSLLVVDCEMFLTGFLACFEVLKAKREFVIQQNSEKDFEDLIEYGEDLRVKVLKFFSEYFDSEIDLTLMDSYEKKFGSIDDMMFLGILLSATDEACDVMVRVLESMDSLV